MATGDKYVMNGVWLTCDKGVAPSRFNVTPKPVQLYDEHFANELDKVPMVNILPFGVCSVTRTPCVPAPVMWERVMEDGLTVMGARPLLDTSKCMCGVGGKIAIHFTKADATAAVELDQQLDQVDEAADAVEEASGWAFWGGLAMGIGGAIMVATGVGAPLGAAMITGAGYLMTASTIAGTAAVAVKGATKFARDPSKEVGLSIVGEVAWEAAKNYIMNKLGGKLIGKLAGSKLGQRIANSSFARKMEDRFANAFARNRNAKPTCVGEPVDVATGKVINKGIDFELGGPLPLVWSRVWYSTSAHEGALGHGWHHSFDEELYADEEVILLRLPDGRYTGTEPLPVGAVVYIREERLTLTHTSAGYAYVDANGLIHEFSYFAATDSYKLTRLSRRAGEGTITLDYSAQGHLALITDSSGRALRVESDAAGRLLSIFAPHPTEARGQVALVRYAYSRQGHLTKATDALGYAWQFRYEGPLLVQATYKNGLSFYYAYDGSDQRARCLRTWGDDGLYACELRYDLEQHQTTVTDSVGAQRVYQYDPELGAVTGFLDARGGATSLEYNEYGELLSLTNPLGYETRFEYDARGNCTTTTLPDGATLHRTFDDYDQLVQAVDAVGGQWQWQYDAQGQLLQCLDPAQQALQYTYHAGRLTSITDVAIDYTLTLAYDQAGNVAELRGSDQRVSRRLYDGWGRVFKSTDPQGTVQWREYDLLSRPVKVHEPDGNVLHFAYDALGNVVYAKDRQREVRYAYRGLGRLIRRVEAGTAVEFLYDTEERLRAVVNEHGLTYRYELDAEGSIVTETGFDGLARSYQRDAGGRVTEVLLPTQERIRHEYDPAGRLTAVTYGDGSRETYRYRTDGALMQADNDTASVQFTRDVLGRVLQEAQGAHTVTSDYDPRGFRLGLTTSLGGEVRYERNARGQVERLQSAGWQAWFERDAQGQELQRTLPGGVHTRWRRDGLGRPTEQRISRQVGHAERTRVYSWQASDQLAHIQDSRSGLTRFEHDSWGNLTTTTFGDGSQQFRLPDAVGNLFDAPPARPAQRYGPAGQLLADANCTYAYDLLGNLVRKTTRQGEEWRYEWNAVGQLTAVIRPDGVAVQFGYDALGRRVYKSCQGKTTRWLWDDNVPLHEWTEYAAGTPAEELVTWLFAEDSLTPVGKLQGAQRYSFIPDHLGTPLEVRDGRGEPLWSGELDSYGRVRGRTPGLTPCPFRYQGQYEDEETGLYYNRFRYYDPSTGVYISQDPSGLQGGPRLYSYVANPATYIDPFGLFPGPGFFSDLKWTGMGHHTVPRAHAAAHNLPKLASRHDAPTWYPQQADVPGSSQIHHDLHLALENNGVPFDPRRGVNPTSQADLLTKARTAYQGFDQKGILRIPSSGEVVADNVTVLEAMEKALEWNKNQCP